MLISIVTPAFNAELFLATTVESALAQTYADWEMVIVDDGSTDSTLEIAQQFADADPRIRAITKANGGVADARNFGMARIDPASRFVMFLDHDDVWKPHAIDCLLAAIAKAPDAVAVHGLARQTDLTGVPYGAPGGTIMGHERRKVVGNRIASCDRTEPTGFSTLLCDCVIPTPGIVLIRRDALEKVAGATVAYFDVTLGSGCDWDLYLRLSLRGDFAFVDEVLIDWRIHGGNGSLDAPQMFAAEAKVRRKMAAWPELTAQQRQMARWRYRSVIASAQRRSADNCRRQALGSVRGGNWREAARLAGMWVGRYARYAGVRLLGSRLVSEHAPTSNPSDTSDLSDSSDLSKA